MKLTAIAEDGKATSGDLWVKWVEKIEIMPLYAPWTVHLEGGVSEELKSETFEAGVKIGGHVSSWTDERGWVGEGLPLWFMVGRVDDITENNRQAFNDALAETGYSVEVISVNGSKQVFTSAEVKRNNEIIVAYRCDGFPITGRNWPLKLVGPNTPSQRQIGQIAVVKLVFP